MRPPPRLLITKTSTTYPIHCLPSIPPNQYWITRRIPITNHCTMAQGYMSPPYGERKPREEFNPEETLWLWRTELEMYHRMDILRQSPTFTYMPSYPDLPAMTDAEFRDTCNKTIPVYGIIQPEGNWRHLAFVLHNYVYRRWFKPYRSEIEHGRFFCKMLAPEDLPGIQRGPRPSRVTLDALLDMHNALCAQVDNFWAVCEEVDRTNTRSSLDNKELYCEQHRWHQLQNLFRVLLIVVCTDSHKGEDSSSAGLIKVCLVRTGIEDNLSAPITFESITKKG